jgi:N,N'-diacetylchitobiose transport system substrate-binding protein
MKPRIFLAIGFALTLVAAACQPAATSPSPSASTQASASPSVTPVTLTVWLMNGSAPDAIVNAVNQEFQTKYPNVTVKVEIQQWSDVTTKLDTAFAGSNPPDVVELGNTLVAKYAAAGALADISGKTSSFENSSSWLKSLTESCTFGGKLFCAPYYAGSRAVIYRTDLFDKAGVKPPTTLDELATVGQKLMDANKSDAQFSALYYPGKYWYAALPFIWEFGGEIAVQDGGKWKGALDSAQAQQGLQTLKNLVDKLSKADKTGDEAKQDQAFAQGHIAMIIANGWEVGVILDPKTGDPTLKDKLGVFPIPGKAAGSSAPVFLGGSDLGIAAKSKNAELATAWVQMLTNAKYQTQMATVGKVIPNTTSLLDLNKADPLLGTFAIAAKNSRFTPNATNWANVESANVIPDMLVSIFTGKSTIANATKDASAKLTQILGQ